MSVASSKAQSSDDVLPEMAQTDFLDPGTVGRLEKESPTKTRVPPRGTYSRVQRVVIRPSERHYHRGEWALARALTVNCVAIAALTWPSAASARTVTVRQASALQATLSPTGELRGRVTNEAGEPLPGARVVLSVAGQTCDSPAAPVTELTAGPGGTFCARLPGAASVDLTVVAAALWGATRTRIAAAGDNGQRPTDLVVQRAPHVFRSEVTIAADPPTENLWGYDLFLHLSPPDVARGSIEVLEGDTSVLALPLEGGTTMARLSRSLHGKEVRIRYLPHDEASYAAKELRVSLPASRFIDWPPRLATAVVASLLGLFLFRLRKNSQTPFRPAPPATARGSSILVRRVLIGPRVIDVRDAHTGRPVPGASVVCGDESCVTDAAGSASLRSRRGTLHVSAVGFREFTTPLVGDQSVRLVSLRRALLGELSARVGSHLTPRAAAEQAPQLASWAAAVEEQAFGPVEPPPGAVEALLAFPPPSSA